MDFHVEGQDDGVFLETMASCTQDLGGASSKNTYQGELVDMGVC